MFTKQFNHYYYFFPLLRCCAVTYLAVLRRTNRGKPGFLAFTKKKHIIICYVLSKGDIADQITNLRSLQCWFLLFFPLQFFNLLLILVINSLLMIFFSSIPSRRIFQVQIDGIFKCRGCLISFVTFRWFLLFSKYFPSCQDRSQLLKKLCGNFNSHHINTLSKVFVVSFRHSFGEE